MKEKLPTKTSEKIRFILSVLVFLAFVPLTIWGIPQIYHTPVSYTHLDVYKRQKLTSVENTWRVTARENRAVPTQKKNHSKEWFFFI